MNILIILIILVFISIIGILIMIFLNSKGIQISNSKEETIQTVALDITGISDKKKNEIHELIEQEKKKYTMNKETINKIKEIYKQGSSENKIAYLTFDDGPSKKVTPQILDILKENNIKATFFVLGSNVQYNKDLIKREYEEGHYIANHGYSHEYETIYANVESVLKEYNDTEKEIQKALGVDTYSSGLFRFPGGSAGGKYAEIKKDAKKLLEENNVAYLDWNSLTSDAVAGTDKEEMVESLKDTVKGKDCVVILMHDAGNKQDTADLLPGIIQYLQDEGYQFKNIYDIMDNNI